MGRAMQTGWVRFFKISPFGWPFSLLLRQLMGLLIAGLAGDVHKPGQKTAARSKAASLKKKSASQRAKTSHPMLRLIR